MKLKSLLYRIVGENMNLGDKPGEAWLHIGELRKMLKLGILLCTIGIMIVGR